MKFTRKANDNSLYGTEELETNVKVTEVRRQTGTQTSHATMQAMHAKSTYIYEYN